MIEIRAAIEIDNGKRCREVSLVKQVDQDTPAGKEAFVREMFEKLGEQIVRQVRII